MVHYSVQSNHLHLVVETISLHADSLLRVARRYTHCQADAEDAYQRTLEILVRSAHRLDPSTGAVTAAIPP